MDLADFPSEIKIASNKKPRLALKPVLVLFFWFVAKGDTTPNKKPSNSSQSTLPLVGFLKFLARDL